MKILKIEAFCEVIKLYTDGDGAVQVRESVPTIGKKPGRTLSMIAAEAKDGVITIPRKENANDRLYSTFTVYAAGEAAEGVRYVTDWRRRCSGIFRIIPRRRSLRYLAVPGNSVTA